jgi:hypothetical protein
MNAKKITKWWNRLRKKDPAMLEPIIEYMFDKKRYRAMKRISRKEARDTKEQVKQKLIDLRREVEERGKK